MPVIREYECSEHGYFTVARNLAEPTIENCDKCGKQAERVYTAAPTMGGISQTSQPDYNHDPQEYRDWQVDAWDKAKDRTHVDNVGKAEPTFKQLTQKTASGKNR